MYWYLLQEQFWQISFQSDLKRCSLIDFFEEIKKNKNNKMSSDDMGSVPELRPTKLYLASNQYIGLLLT